MATPEDMIIEMEMAACDRAARARRRERIEVAIHLIGPVVELAGLWGEERRTKVRLLVKYAFEAADIVLEEADREARS
jgi:hypothetical protein